MPWVRHLFKEQQVSDCLFVLSEFRKDWGKEVAWKDVESRASVAIKKNADTVRSKILTGGESPKNLVLTVVANVALDAAGSGNYHIYRGTLSLIGISYRSIFHKAVAEQAESSFITAEDKKQAIQNLAEAIKDAG